MRGRPCFIEDIANHRQRTGHAEIRQQFVHADKLAEAAGFQVRRKIPVIKRRIELAMQHLACKQCRRAVYQLCLCAQINTSALPRPAIAASSCQAALPRPREFCFAGRREF